MAEIEIRSERVDDIPLLLRQMQAMGLPAVLDAVIKVHGNRTGLSVGWLTIGWLAYILSQADHRLYEVEPWAVKEKETLAALIPQDVGPKDFTDDRLAAVLRDLSDDAVWEEVETQVGQRLIRVYDLHGGLVRLDSTSAAVYHDAEGNRFFHFGVSKDHRPDLPQFKVMLASLDPLGMPLATLPVPGNRADDGLYLPAISHAQAVLGTGGRLYVGDAKMAALSTRGTVEASGDFYLLPLPQTGEVPDLLKRLLEPVGQRQAGKRQQALRAIRPPGPGEAEGFSAVVEAADCDQGATPAVSEPVARSEILAWGFEATRLQHTLVAGTGVVWSERILVVYSPSLARTTRRNLTRRLAEAERALRDLTPPPGKGQRQQTDLAALETAGQALLKKYRVADLLAVSYRHEVDERPIRRYGDQPERIERRERYVVQVQRQPTAIVQARRLLGWRLYVTNAPPIKLSLVQAVWAYRGAPRIERGFHRLKGQPLGIRPLYLEREDHARGMVRLLSLGLRVLTLVEHVVRQGLKQASTTLAGLYGGNPERASARPTTERLLKAFDGITLSVVKLPGQTIRHITPLSELQRRILGHLGLPTSIYADLALHPDSIPP